jgi:hypothetical protein
MKIIERNNATTPIDPISKDAPIIDEVEELAKMYLFLTNSALSTKHDRSLMFLCAEDLFFKFFLDINFQD